jgi:hypothetical protein
MCSAIDFRIAVIGTRSTSPKNVAATGQPRLVWRRLFANLFDGGKNVVLRPRPLTPEPFPARAKVNTMFLCNFAD